MRCAISTPAGCINRRADGGLELPLKVVQARLGHASIQITADRYGHLFPRTDDGAESAAGVFGELMGQRRPLLGALIAGLRVSDR
jgi:hypothetical protein